MRFVVKIYDWSQNEQLTNALFLQFFIFTWLET
ncbi:hypothetical protein FSU_0936 [Fibrobacter succinogenes subsp. succinogenes S85]|uniref:Uncharacterized protein n=1 Tax=Fibrobacter succinogenes (strain ATCC 19169 / S85) TaxID=59374 RepID=D9S8T8_FIBSS|nr:hypothetical protein FSU_0936 [Fibrobacter succinogenes subsp. succinogenes S85]